MSDALTKESKSLLDAVKQWPDGDYVLLAGASGCPNGFDRVDTQMSAIAMFREPGSSQAQIDNYIKRGTFGASSIACHGACGQYGVNGASNASFMGDLRLTACVKTKVASPQSAGAGQN